MGVSRKPRPRSDGSSVSHAHQARLHKTSDLKHVVHSVLFVVCDSIEGVWCLCKRRRRIFGSWFTSSHSLAEFFRTTPLRESRDRYHAFDEPVCQPAYHRSLLLFAKTRGACNQALKG